MTIVAESKDYLKKFSYKKTFIVGFGFLGISIIWPIFNQFVPIFLQAGNPEFERQLLEAGRELPQVVGFGLTPALALFRSPTVSWLGDLFIPDDRSKANGIINLMGGIGALLAFFGGGYLFNNFARAAPFHRRRDPPRCRDGRGAYTGLYYFSSQLAAVLGPTMGGVMVDILGDQYRWLFMYDAIFIFLALLAITRVKR